MALAEGRAVVGLPAKDWGEGEVAWVMNKEEARKRAAQLAPRPTKRQIEHLERLLNDVGFGTRIARNAFLSGRIKREVKYIDDLTFDEASDLIDELTKKRDRSKKESTFDRWTNGNQHRSFNSDED